MAPSDVDRGNRKPKYHRRPDGGLLIEVSGGREAPAKSKGKDEKKTSRAASAAAAGKQSKNSTVRSFAAGLGSAAEARKLREERMKKAVDEGRKGKSKSKSGMRRLASAFKDGKGGVSSYKSFMGG